MFQDSRECNSFKCDLSENGESLGKVWLENALKPEHRSRHQFNVAELALSQSVPYISTDGSLRFFRRDLLGGFKSVHLYGSRQ